MLSVPTTYREPKGLFVLEALANGVPVVLPRHGSFPELVEATGGGVLVEPGSPDALAEALGRCSSTGARRRELGRRGREAVHRRFGDRQAADGLRAVYARGARRGGGGGTARWSLTVHEYAELRTRRKVEFADTDMGGIVHFSRFFVYMETAEHEFLNALGTTVHFEIDGPPSAGPAVGLLRVPGRRRGSATSWRSTCGCCARGASR